MLEEDGDVDAATLSCVRTGDSALSPRKLWKNGSYLRGLYESILTGDVGAAGDRELGETPVCAYGDGMS